MLIGFVVLVEQSVACGSARESTITRELDDFWSRQLAYTG